MEEKTGKNKENDVTSMINVIFKNTKGDIDITSIDPLLEKAEMLFLPIL